MQSTVPMFSRKYIYTNKQHTGKGIMSSILGLINLITIAYVVYNTYARGGSAPLRYASACFLVLVFAFAGIILGLIGRQEAERFHVFAYVGMLLNVLAIMGISGILYAGAYM